MHSLRLDRGTEGPGGMSLERAVPTSVKRMTQSLGFSRTGQLDSRDGLLEDEAVASLCHRSLRGEGTLDRPCKCGASCGSAGKIPPTCALTQN